MFFPVTVFPFKGFLNLFWKDFVGSLKGIKPFEVWLIWVFVDRIFIEVNIYERSAINRQVCIIINGCICKVCAFDFEKTFGAIGSGFIHVHHVVPVSMLGEGYLIDPSKDLVPVCPNCHAMLHKSNPPYTIEKIKKILLIV
jgi:predicted HNH restriction endonuclease